MPTYYMIPLQGISQSFQITLAGIIYNLTVKWNDPLQCWFLDIADINNVSIVAGLPLVTGANILDGLNYLEIGGQLWVLTTNGGQPTDIPNYSALGATINLYFYTSNPNE